MNEIYANDYRDLEHLVERMEEFIDWRFSREVRHIWRKWLSRRTRGNGMTWETFAPTEPSTVATAYPTFLEWCRESRLRNPLR